MIKFPTLKFQLFYFLIFLGKFILFIFFVSFSLTSFAAPRLISKENRTTVAAFSSGERTDNASFPRSHHHPLVAKEIEVFESYF